MENKINTTNSIKISYWNADGIRNKKEELLYFLQDQDIGIMVLTPTHHGSTSRPEILDMAITKNIDNELELEAPPELSSGHNQIILTVANLAKIPPRMREIK